MILSNSVYRLLLSAFLAFGFANVYTVHSQPRLLKDVNVDTEYTSGSFPRGLVSMNGLVFFAASDAEHGRELWQTDGTPGGTGPVKDIAVGQSGANVSEITAIGNTVWFSATDPLHGQELWKSDGTESGTTILEVVPGAGGAFPLSIRNNNGNILFTAQDTEHGRELWTTDGTAAGTVLVKDIVPGAGSGFDVFSVSAVVNSVLLFTVNDGIHGTELWKSDGTDAGTALVKDITPGSASSQFAFFVAVGNHLYFMANDGVHGQELWISDGTEAGTKIVKDIEPGQGASGVSPVVSFGGEIFFTITTPSRFELWKTDGTEIGTVVLNDALPAREGPHLGQIISSEDKLYFTAGAQELWTSDGTGAGTLFVKQFAVDTQVQPLGAEGTSMFISANDGVTGQELWKTDGTEPGTVLVKDINTDGPSYPGSSYPASWAIQESKFYFVADDGIHGEEMWISDGTEEGTVLIENINKQSKYSPTELRTIGNDLFFINHRSENTYEVWKSVGTPEGTTLIKDINPGVVQFGGGTIQVSDEKLFMVLDDGSHGFEVWVSDGTTDGTKLLKDIRTGTEGSGSQLPENQPLLNGDLFFQADDGINGPALWKTDGTEDGTVMIKTMDSADSYVNSMLPVGDILYFVTAFALWKTDGTEAGTVKVKQVNPTFTGYNPSYLYNMNGTLYFVGTDGAHGLELWRSDGTESGTYMVKDIRQDDSDHWINIVGDVEGKLILGAATTGFDYELWMSDGTESGTVLLKEINSLQGSSPYRLSQNDDHVFFTATDAEHGNELWKTDGTPEGTVMVKDIFPGITNSSISHSTMYKGNLFFSANDGIHGSEVWRTNGLADGTKLLTDIQAGEASSSPDFFTSTERFLYFRADDGTHGREAWVLETTSQTITFVPLSDRVANDSPFALEAVASSGLPVTFSVVSGPATIAGNMVTLTGSGEVVIRASQPGDDQTDPAVVERSFQVTKAGQTISFEPLMGKKSDDPPFEITATSSSGFPVSFTILNGPATISQATVTITGAGEVTVEASQPGNEIYSPAENVLQSFSVELVVGLVETPEDAISIFPNPASDVLHVNVSQGSGVSAIKLFDLNGQRVWEPQGTLNILNLSIDTGKLLPGVYLLRIRQQDRVLLKKVIVD